MGSNLVIRDAQNINGTIVSFSGYESQINYEFFENFDSVHTKIAYKTDLVQFFKFINKNFGAMSSPMQLEKMHVIAYRNALQTSKVEGHKVCCPKTIIRKLAAITSYCNFLIEKGLMASNPTANIKRPLDQVVTETNDLTDEQVKILLNSIDLSKRSGPLHKAVLFFLFSTGIRKSELINLKLEDYQEHQGIKIIQYIGKRGKIARTPLHPTAIYFLENYLAHMKSAGNEIKVTDYIFQGCGSRSIQGINKKLQATSIDYIVKYHCKKIGLTENITPHSARATLIGSLLQSGCDIYKVSQLVNHSNVKTTQAYDKRKKSLIDSPVFKLKYV